MLTGKGNPVDASLAADITLKIALLGFPVKSFGQYNLGGLLLWSQHNGRPAIVKEIVPFHGR